MTWTVLGASGTVGRRLVERLRSQGADVYTPTRGCKEIWHRPLGHVVYAIGLTADFRQRPFDTVEAHVGLLSEVLQHCEFDSLLYLSSTRLYARSESATEASEVTVKVQDPSDLYNLSKLMGESLCLQSGRDRVRVVRLSNVVGGDDESSGNFLPVLIREAKAGRIVLRTAIDSAKDYVHIDDVTGVLPLIAEHGTFDMYNVASGVLTEHRQWVDLLQLLTGCVVNVEPNAPSVRFPPVCINRVRDEFGFSPRPALEALAGLVCLNRTAGNP